MPSPTNSSGATLGVSSPTRGDGVTNRQLPLETYANQATRTVANIGQAVVGNTPQAQAAMPPPQNRRPANPAPAPAAAQPSAVVASAPPAVPSLGLQTASTIVLAGSAVTSPERSIAMVRNRGENAINPIIPVSSGSDRTRRPASERDRERERRDDPKARSTGGSGAVGPTGRSNDGSSQDEGEDSKDGRPRARRDGDTNTERSLAVDPSAPEAGRTVNRPSFNTVQDASGMTVYIGRMNTTEVPNLLVNRTFVKKMRTIGIAVRDPNGNRIGAPPPAPLMELCQTRQRYVLEGTCR